MTNATGRTALSRAQRDREVVQRTAELLTSSLSLEDLFHAVCSLLARFVDASMVFVALKDREGARIAFMLENGVVGKLENRRVRPESRTAEVMRTGRPILKRRLQDWTEGRLALNLPGQPQNDERVSAIFVPLKFGTDIIGVLSVQSVLPDAYTEEEVQLLRTCALYLSVRIHQAQLETVSARLENIASTDTLTGVPNRRSFNQRFMAEWRRGVRRSTGISMLLIDIDFFKPFNDTYGHVAGDAALQQVANALTSCLSRSEDFFARFGGEEFVAILPDTNLSGALAIAERMRSAVFDLGIAHSGSLLGRLTISAGVASKTPVRALSRDTLVEAADAALYQAKRSGRNRVAGENYRSDAPPAYASRSYRHNLPEIAGRTYGRTEHLTTLRKLLRVSRFVTISGPAGLGKSREAIELAWREIARFPDGLCYVDCSTVLEKRYLANKIAAVVGVRETSLLSAATAVGEFLRPKRMLLVLDNADAIVREFAQDAAALLTSARDLRIVMTCREPHRLGGEVAYTLPPLAQEDAVAFFLDRAIAIAGAETLDAPTVERICRHLQGLPRAIQLAAAQLRTLSLKEIAQRLPDQTALGREAAGGFVEWSYRVLSHAEQALLRGLAVFGGGASREAIHEICGSADALASLVEKGLVGTESGETGERYVVPGSIRAFATERAIEQGEWKDLGLRHAAYICARARALDAAYSTKEWRSAFSAMLPEVDNVRAALLFTVTNKHDLQLGAEISGYLVHYWDQMGRATPGCEWFEELLTRNDVLLPKRLQARLLYGVARLDTAHTRRALDAALRATALYRELGDDRGLAASLYEASAAYIGLHEFEEAAKHLGESRDLCERIGDRRCLADVLNGTGVTESWRGHPDRARELHEQSLALLRDLEDDRGVASLLGNLGDLAASVGEYDRAVTLTRQGLAIFERLADPQSTAWCLTNLGAFEIKRGDGEAAHPALRRALEIVREYQDDWLGANCVDALARLAMSEKDWARALQLSGFADSVFESSGATRQPFDQLDYENLVREAENVLGADATIGELRRGRRLEWSDILREVLQT